MLLTGVMLAARVSAHTNGLSIGLNFAATDPDAATSSLAAGELAGVVPSANWNNLAGATGFITTVVSDNAGTASSIPVSLRWTSPNTWRCGANNLFPVGPNRKLMSGYLDTGNAATNGVFLALSNLPPAFATNGYEVYVYFARDATNNTGGAYTLTNEAGFIRKYGSTLPSPSSFVQDPGTDADNSLDGTYLRFTGLGGSWFTLKSDTTLTIPNGTRAPVNALEIVALPCTPAGIAVQPSGVAACAGSTVLLAVSASGSAPTYQWRRNGTNLIDGATGRGSVIAGASGPTLTIISAAEGDSASAAEGYDCVIAVACNSTTTNSARVALAINPAATVFSVTGGGSDCSGTGLPVGLSGSEIGVDYRLRTNGVFNGVLLAGTGSSLDFGNQTLGRTYTVQASNSVAGGCTALMAGSATVTIIAPTLILAGPTPIAATNAVGGTASFSVTASGRGLSYQWFRDGVPLANGGSISGVTSSNLVISPLAITDTAVSSHGYRCLVSGSCGSVLSGEATLSVVSPPVTPPLLTEAWVQRYNGPTSSSDGASKVVVDAEGNVIVAGNSTNNMSGSDIVTIKYSSTGMLLWSNRFDGPHHRDDAVYALAVDTNGNVLVAGSTDTTNTFGDGYVAKFAAANGALLWEKTLVISNSADVIQALAVNQNGDVLVGASLGVSTGYVARYAGVNGATIWQTNFSTVNIRAVAVAFDSVGQAGIAIGSYVAKYNATNGSLLWEKRYAGRTNFNAIAIDGNGDLLASGSTDTFGGDFFTAKFAAANGTLMWSKTYAGPGGSTDQPAALALDANGDVFVTGSSAGSGTGSDFYTAKYASADGALLWEKRYSSGPSTADGATALALDGNGNAVVTGFSAGTGSDFYTAKYAAADGTLLWEKRYNSPANGGDAAGGVALDSSGNVHVTGASPAPGTALDIYTAKYAATDGALVWEQRFDSPGNDFDYSRATAVDANGDVLVTGYAKYPTNSFDIYTAKYSGSTGALLWSTRHNGPSNGWDEGTGIAVDANNDVIVIGVSHGGATGNDFYTVKYSGLNGSVIWEKRHDVSPSDRLGSVAVDAAGNVAVTGSSYFDSFTQWIYTAKYAAADGTLLWEHTYLGAPRAIANAVAVDGSGNVIVTGYDGDINSGSIYLYTAKHAAANGSVIWTKNATLADKVAGQSIDVALDANGNVFIAGLTTGPDFYTAKYAAANGALLWEKRYNGPGPNGSASALAVDTSGNVVVTGNSGNYFGTDRDFLTVKYSGANGALLWEKRYTTGIAGDSAAAVTLDTNGNAFVTGVIFGGTANSDYFTLLYSSATGAELWSARYDGPYNSGDGPRGLAVTPSGDVVVTGESAGGFGGGSPDYATVKYTRFSFAPYASSVVMGSNMTFTAVGGQPPYQFAITTNNSGGAIDPSTGVYTAGGVCGAFDTITLTDSHQLTLRATVRVAGTAPPSITCPPDMVIQADRLCGTNVTFSVAASDSCGLALMPIVSPPSGSQFPAGTTTVNCTAVDDLGRTTNCSFTVTVQLTSPNCAPMPSGLVGFWRGEYDALDSVGINHGTLNGPISFNPCSVGGAGFNFTAPPNWVTVPYTPAVQQTNVTVEAWVYAQGAPTTQAGIAGTWNDLTGGANTWRRTYLMWVFNGRLEMLCGSGTGFDRATDSVNLPTNTWVHVAGTYDGSTIRLYRDGVQVASKAYAGILNTNDQPFYIGRTDAGADGADYWRGLIDDVTVYSRALTSNEIAAIYAAGSAGKCLDSQPLPLAVAPASIDIVPGGTVNFLASGGQPPYQFTIATNNSGGSIKTNTGAYTAGSVCGTSDTIQVTDVAQSTARASVRIVDPLPPTITCLSNLSVQCLADVPARPATLAQFRALGGQASDNSGTNLAYTCSDSLQASNGCSQVIHRTHTVTDACTNSASCVQIITVHDTIPPIIVCPLGLTVSCLADIPARPASLVQFLAQGGAASDNCDMNLSYTCTDSPLTGGLCSGTIIRTHTVFDDCTNAASCQQIITVLGSPMLVTCPTNRTVNCGAVWDFDSPLVSGGCCGSNVLITVESTITNGSCPQTVSRTWRITDCCTNAFTCSQTVTVRDTAPGCFPVPTGLVAWWAAEDNGEDELGVSDGLPKAGVTFSDGRVGKCFAFTGGDDAVNVVGSASGPLDLTGTGLTLEAWIKPSSLHNASGMDMIIVDKWDGMSGPNGYSLYLADGGYPALLVATADNARFLLQAAEPLVIGEWVLLVATYDGTSAELFVNGVQRASEPLTGAILHQGFDLAIGNLTGGGTDFGFPGLIDEVAVYNRALTTSEITGIYEAGAGGKCRPLRIRPASVTVPAGHPVSFGAVGGQGAYQFSLTQNQSGGTVTPSGSYTAGGTPGTDKVQVVDAANGMATATVTVIPPPLGISPLGVTLPKELTTTFEAFGGTPPYTFSIVSSPAHGSINPITGIYGATPQCPATDVIRVTDSAGATADSFVLIPDGTAPVIACPADIHALAGTTSGKVVYFTVTADDSCGSGVVVNCLPPSGSAFPIGTTTVQCTATDAGGNQATCSFTVTVSPEPALPVADCVPAPDQIVGSWSGEYTAQDGAQHHDGTLQNGANFSLGYSGHSFALDGTDDYIRIPDQPSLELAGDLTVQLWAKQESPGVYQCLVSKGGGGSSPGGPSMLTLSIMSDGRLVGGFARADGSMVQVDTASPIPNPEKFHHYAYVRSGTSQSLFLDGHLAATATFTGGPGSSAGADLLLGASASTAGGVGANVHDFFSGRIDEVIIHRRALSSDEILGQYTCTEGSRIEIAGIEVVQSIQDWKNSVPLIADKDTYVRVNIRNPSGAPPDSRLLTGRLRGYRDGAELPESPLSALYPGFASTEGDTMSRRRNFEVGTLNFQLPTHWCATGSVTLQFQGDSRSPAFCLDPSGLEKDCSVRVAFQAMGVLKLKLFRVNSFSEPTPEQFFRELAKLKSMFPISGLDFELSDVPVNCYCLGTLEYMRVLDGCGRACQTIYFGALRDEAEGGVANLDGSVAAGSLRTLHHEIAHTLGVDHTARPSGNPIEPWVGFCGERPGAPQPIPFPYPALIDGYIYPALGPTDLAHPEDIIFGLQGGPNLDLHAGNPSVIDPFREFDLMSYCNDIHLGWVSAFSYQRLMDGINRKFAPAGMFSPASAILPRSGNSLLIGGRIIPQANLAELDPILPAFVPAFEVPAPGPFNVQLLDAAGTVLSETWFQPNQPIIEAPGASSSALHFAFLVPHVPAVTRAIVRSNNTVIGSVERSSHAPVLALLAPVGGESFTGPTVLITWDASDADGDPLTFTVQYSANNDDVFTTLATGETNHFLQLPRSALAGSANAVVRVVASDGFNYDVQTSRPFSVAGHRPVVFLRSPATNALFSGDALIFFEAIAHDIEDGSRMSDISWSSSLDGVIGRGAAFERFAKSLSEGTHLITATVTDSAGLTDTASTVVRIARFRQPRLEALPFDAGGRFGVRIIVDPGASYVLQTSTNLLDWLPLRTNTTMSVLQEVRTLPSEGFMQRFYRARLEP